MVLFSAPRPCPLHLHRRNFHALLWASRSNPLHRGAFVLFSWHPGPALCTEGLCKGNGSQLSQKNPKHIFLNSPRSSCLFCPDPTQHGNKNTHGNISQTRLQGTYFLHVFNICKFNLQVGQTYSLYNVISEHKALNLSAIQPKNKESV